MGNFSRQTYDRLKHYVGVRLQQGVPIVDADWNEQDDLRRFEVQAFLKWFVGNGVPRGSDGFRISSAGAADDFEIAAGRCLVEGWDAINDWDERDDGVGRTYRSQPLYGNAALAAAWGVTPLPPLTRPLAPRTDRVYLDVWEREVGAVEDPALVNPVIGIETSVRIRREWVVRVAEGATALPAAPAGHVFYELATLARRGAPEAAITSGQITDRRRTGLTVVSQHDLRQITADAYGQDYTLDTDGQPNLKVSLREAVNALMRNQLPGTRPVQVSPGAGSFNTGGRNALVDSTGAAWILWTVGDESAEIWYRRNDPATGAWRDAARLSAVQGDTGPVAAVDDGRGHVWVFWSRSGGSNLDVWYDRWSHAGGSWDGAKKLTTGTDSKGNVNAVVDRDGTVWVFWLQFPPGGGGSYTLRYSRYDQASGTWSAAARLTNDTANDWFHTAAVDSENGIWVIISRESGGTYDLWWTRYVPSTKTWTTVTRFTSDAAPDLIPSAVVDTSGNVWVFWYAFRVHAAADIYCRRYDWQTRAWSAEQQLSVNMGNNGSPAALAGRNNDVWVFWESLQGDGGTTVYKRFTPESGWSAAVQLASGPGYSWQPIGVMDPAGDIWAFWAYSFKDQESIWHRKLVTAI